MERAVSPDLAHSFFDGTQDKFNFSTQAHLQQGFLEYKTSSAVSLPSNHESIVSVLLWSLLEPSRKAKIQPFPLNALPMVLCLALNFCLSTEEGR